MASQSVRDVPKRTLWAARKKIAQHRRFAGKGSISSSQEVLGDLSNVSRNAAICSQHLGLKWKNRPGICPPDKTEIRGRRWAYALLVFGRFVHQAIGSPSIHEGVDSNISERRDVVLDILIVSIHIELLFVHLIKAPPNISQHDLYRVRTPTPRHCHEIPWNTEMSLKRS